MKKLLLSILPITLIVVVFVSCSSEESQQEEPQQPEAIIQQTEETNSFLPAKWHVYDIEVLDSTGTDQMDNMGEGEGFGSLLGAMFRSVYENAVFDFNEDGTYKTAFLTASNSGIWSLKDGNLLTLKEQGADSTVSKMFIEHLNQDTLVLAIKEIDASTKEFGNQSIKLHFLRVRE